MTSQPTLPTSYHILPRPTLASSAILPLPCPTLSYPILHWILLPSDTSNVVDNDSPICSGVTHGPLPGLSGGRPDCDNAALCVGYVCFNAVLWIRLTLYWHNNYMVHFDQLLALCKHALSLTNIQGMHLYGPQDAVVSDH